MDPRPALALLASVILGLPVHAQDRPPTPSERNGFNKALVTPAPLPTETTPVAIPLSPGPSTTAIENSVLAAHDAFLAAIEALEFEKLAAMTVRTNRGALVADGRTTLSNDEMVARIERDFATLDTVHHAFDRRLVSLLSPTTALIVAEGTVTARGTDGGSFTRPITQTLIFMRVDETWKVVHLHASTPPAVLGR